MFLEHMEAAEDKALEEFGIPWLLDCTKKPGPHQSEVEDK